jgi:hypothetical protein
MGWKWFVQSGDRIEGPLTTDEVQTRVHTGQMNPNYMIWGPGAEEWQRISTWSQNIDGMAGTMTMIEPVNDTWHYASGGQSKGPMTRENLISQLRTVGNIGEVMLWTKGMKEWAPLFEFHDMLTELGINKRIFPRAELSGKDVIKTAGQTLIAPLFSISEGGFGVQLDGGLVSGETCEVEIQSPSFREPLHVKADVRYSSGGVIGFKFNQLSVETKGSIIQFIRQTQTRFNIKAA